MCYNKYNSRRLGEDVMAVQSEQKLENKLINKLVQMGYEYRKDIITYDLLLENLREIVNEHNIDSLKGKELSDKEFERLLVSIENKNIIESANIIRDKVVITRDNGEELYIELYQKIKWCQNKFQVINQLQMTGIKKHRYDVTILINGLPLVHIELKREARDIKKAFEQINNYKRDSMGGLWNLTQLFVITNGSVTKYFANGNDLNYNFTFYWTDEENRRIQNLQEFAESFLEKCHLSEMIARYMVIQEKQIKVLRPYQVYAVRAIIKRATETKNNGYIWHTTGSGKTLTSFKVAQILKTDENVQAKKIIFLVDRRDLDSQTASEFKEFGGEDFLEEIPHSRALRKKLLSNLTTDKMIISTIQKMDRLLSKKNAADVIEKYESEKVIFIIDECHRSQYGKMHANVKRVFKNAQYFGFTGTPLLKEEQTSGERLTGDTFEKCLHRYLIKDAIADKNVLGFNVDYYSKKDIDESNDEKMNIRKYANVGRLETIAETIVDKHNHITANGKYCALFTVQNIDTLIMYYEIFKNINKDDLKVSAIYSLNKASDQDGEKLDRHIMAFKGILSDYNEMFDKNYSIDRYDGFFGDVNERVKNGTIDLVIVVDMLLTGFDSQKLNTLYVDKNLRYHNLVQAYSRTNRIENNRKMHGNIICFRDLKEETDDAIKLFSDEDSTENIIIRTYREQLEEIKPTVDILNTYGTINDIVAIQSEEEKLKFVEAVKAIVKKINVLETFTEFDYGDINLYVNELLENQEFLSDHSDKNLEELLKVAIEYKLDQVKSVYTDLAYDIEKRKREKSEEDETELDDFEFELELVRTDKIDVDYILMLLNDKLNSKVEEGQSTLIIRHQELDNIKKELDKSMIHNKDVFNDFIENRCNELIESENEIDYKEEYNKFKDEKLEAELVKYAYENEVKKEELEYLITALRFSGRVDLELVKKMTKDKNLKFKEKKEFRNKTSDFIIDLYDKYGENN